MVKLFNDKLDNCDFDTANWQTERRPPVSDACTHLPKHLKIHSGRSLSKGCILKKGIAKAYTFNGKMTACFLWEQVEIYGKPFHKTNMIMHIS